MTLLLFIGVQLAQEVAMKFLELVLLQLMTFCGNVEWHHHPLLLQNLSWLLKSLKLRKIYPDLIRFRNIKKSFSVILNYFQFLPNFLTGFNLPNLQTNNPWAIVQDIRLKLQKVRKWIHFEEETEFLSATNKSSTTTVYVSGTSSITLHTCCFVHT